MLSFSSFSIKDILTGRVTREMRTEELCARNTRAAQNTCTTNRGLKGPGLTRKDDDEKHIDSERHFVDLSLSEGNFSSDSYGEETAGEETAATEGRHRGNCPCAWIF